MPQLAVRPLVPADLPACARLFVARHQRDAARLKHLEPSLSDEAHVRATLEASLTPHTDAAVVLSGETVVGFLLGDRMLFPPTDFLSQYIPPYSIAIGVEAHAVDPAYGIFEVYRALYGFLAETWVAEGFFIHRIGLPAGDPELQEAWVALGFGRQQTAATRETALPVESTVNARLTVERASPEDIDEVMVLADELTAWHWRSPIFWPVLHAAAPASRDLALTALRSADSPFFVAYDGGRAVGMQTFLRPGFTPPIVERSRDVYLYEGIVSEQARGSGAGVRLLKESMAWARSAGLETCTLHFAPANPSGAPFWLSHGFVPVEHTMERVIDSRVAWARPR